MTSIDSTQEQAARTANLEYDGDESSSDFDDGDQDGPTFVLELTDFFGRRHIPHSRDPSDTFTMRTDTLRAFMTRYRRLLGRNRRALVRSRARTRVGHDGPYMLTSSS